MGAPGQDAGLPVDERAVAVEGEDLESVEVEVADGYRFLPMATTMVAP